MKHKCLKFFAVLACLTMSAGVVACGGKSGGNSTSSSSEVVSSSEAGSSFEASSSSEESSSSEDVEESSEVVDESSEAMDSDSSEVVDGEGSEESSEESEESSEVVDESSEVVSSEDSSEVVDESSESIEDSSEVVDSENSEVSEESSEDSSEVVDSERFEEISSEEVSSEVVEDSSVEDSSEEIEDSSSEESSDNSESGDNSDADDQTPPVPHTHAYDNDCDESCNTCEEVRSVTHDYSRWNITKTPTDLEAGAQERYCSACGLSEAVDMPVLVSTSLEYFTLEEYPISNVMYYKITNYTGDFAEVAVPRTYNNCEIRVIATDAFKNHTEITTLYIPDTVCLIEEAAFNGCSGIQTLTIPFVGGNKFRTYTQSYQYPLGYIFGGAYYSSTVWDGMTQISQQYYGANTKNVTSQHFAIPQNLETVSVTGGNILHGAFMSCTSIKTLLLSTPSTEIRPYAFHSMYNLEYVTLPSGLKTIGEYAFAYCYYLKKIEFPSTLQSIETYAFYSCKYALSTVVIPNSVKTIGEKAFANCDALKYIYCEAESKPSGWKTSWNPSGCSIVWGYTTEE